MIGAIIGDIAGSTYEFSNCKNAEMDLFPAGSAFTDDTILTVATANALLGDGDYETAYRDFGRRYPDPMGGYGARFHNWIWTDAAGPYNSYGNGAAMRVSPVGFACENLESVRAEAKRSAMATHNHPEGIRGAQAAAVAVFMGRTSSSVTILVAALRLFDLPTHLMKAVKARSRRRLSRFWIPRTMRPPYVWQSASEVTPIL